LVKTVDQCKTLLNENASLSQKCHELELKVSFLGRYTKNEPGYITVLFTSQISSLRDEKQLLLSENAKLRVAASAVHEASEALTGTVLLGATSTITGDPVAASLSPTVANVRIGQLQDQLTKLRNEIYRLETGK
ncbi:hypothetical protein FGIG_05023, partial [Fasciola gigantica]